MRFTKVEGCGNHFILFDLRRAPLSVKSLNTKKIIELCDPNFGVGADGILLIKTLDLTTTGTLSSDAQYEMIIYNADGSLAKMCGNGLRCAASYLFKAQDHVNTSVQQLSILTGGGVFRVTRSTQRGPEYIGVQMGWPNTVNEVYFNSTKMDVHSFGNPHIVTFDPSLFEQRRDVAPAMGALLTDGVNVSFASHREGTRLTLHVYERGCGWTLACGTGACATVYQGICEGRFKEGDSVRVSLPGGELTIDIKKAGLTMWGPAKDVFTGELSERLSSGL